MALICVTIKEEKFTHHREAKLMKKVVLLGDSIRLIGYAPRIPELLGDGYTVWQSDSAGQYGAALDDF